MFCRYCGRKQKDDAEFCVNCGKLLHEKESETTESNRTDPITVEEPSQDATGPQKSKSPEEEIWARIVGKNADYYLPQFTKIKAGERGAFNWAAFFLGLPHAAYRGVWKAWLSFMKIPLIGMAAGYLLGYIGLSVQVMFLFGAGAVVCLAASVMQIVYLAYRYPKQFNRMYWNYVEKQAQQEVPSVGPFMGRVVAAMLILAVIGVASSTLSATALLSALAGDDFLMEDSGPYLTDPAPLQEETEVSNNTSPPMREEIDYNELEHPTGFIVSYDGVDYTYDAPIKDELSDSKILKDFKNTEGIGDAVETAKLNETIYLDPPVYACPYAGNSLAFVAAWVTTSDETWVIAYEESKGKWAFQKAVLMGKGSSYMTLNTMPTAYDATNDLCTFTDSFSFWQVYVGTMMIHSGKYETEGGSNDGYITYYIYVLNEVDADVDTYAVTYTNDSKYGWEYSVITYVSPGSEHATDKLGILTTAATYGYLRDPDFVVFYLEPQTNGNYILYFNVCDPEFGWIGDGLQPGKKVQVSTENQTLSWSAEDNTLFEIGFQDDEFFSLTGNESYFRKITDGKATQSQLENFVISYF